MLHDVVLWLFVIFAGLAAGAGLFEMRINVPRWFPRTEGSRLRVDAEAMRTDDTGRRFWAWVTTVPLTLLTLASLAIAWSPRSPQERWWLIAAGILLAERIGTLGYFIPRAVRLLRAETLPAGAAQPMALQWQRLNYLRIVLALAGWLASLRALSLSA